VRVVAAAVQELQVGQGTCCLDANSCEYKRMRYSPLQEDVLLYGYLSTIQRTVAAVSDCRYALNRH